MFWIEGWVEVTYLFEAEQDDNYAWQGLINLSPLVDNDDVAEQLFGLSKRCVASEYNIASLAAKRGLPPNISDLAKADLMARGIFDGKPTGEIGGFTYATWHEIKNFPIDENTMRESDWQIVFDLVQLLEQRTNFESGRRYADDQIRFVVWYNW